MSNNYGFKQYKQTSVTTASKGQVLLMLYEGAIKFTKLAIEGIKEKNLVKKGENLIKVHDIINELSLSLDHKVGGSISKELERLYIFMVDQLTEANLKNVEKPLEEVLKLLETLFDGWQGAIKQVAKFGGDPAAAAAAEIANGTAPVQQAQTSAPAEQKSSSPTPTPGFSVSPVIGGKPIGRK